MQPTDAVLNSFDRRVLKMYLTYPLERGAISREQYDKALGELTKRLGMETRQ